MTELEKNKVYVGDCLDVLKTFPSESIDMCITSPPYWGLRDYGVDDQLGLEETPEEFIDKLCDVFDEVKRVLKPAGSCWVNLGDSYCRTPGQQDKSGKTGIKTFKYGYDFKHKKNYGSAYKPKSLVQIPSRFSIEMTNRGWILRNEIIWHKPSCLPASVKDRYTVDFEKMFFFTKNPKYYFKQQLEDTVDSLKRNKRTVWHINTATFKDAHFAVYPPDLLESPIDACCPNDGVVLDPFFGSGTTAQVALSQDKDWVGIELNPEYEKISEKRLKPKIIEKKTRDKANEFWNTK
jgi:DNA modification methylase